MSFEKSSSQGWDPEVVKSDEQIEQNVLMQRVQTIENYREILMDVKQTIAKLRLELTNIQKDITQEHDKRLKEYADREKLLQVKHDNINALQADIHTQSINLEARHRALESAAGEEIDRFNENNKRLEERQAQLDALDNELNAKKIQIETLSKEHAIQSDELKQKEENLTNLKAEIDGHINDIKTKRHEIDVDIELHQMNMKSYTEAVTELEITEKKNKEFYDALIEKEKSLEPLKQQYEDGMLATQKEAMRLRDESIRVFATTKDAEKRLAVALEAEQRAKDAIEKLETLKTEIHGSITTSKES